LKNLFVSPLNFYHFLKTIISYLSYHILGFLSLFLYTTTLHTIYYPFFYITHPISQYYPCILSKPIKHPLLKDYSYNTDNSNRIQPFLITIISLRTILFSLEAYYPTTLNHYKTIFLQLKNPTSCLIVQYHNLLKIVCLFLFLFQFLPILHYQSIPFQL